MKSEYKLFNKILFDKIFLGYVIIDLSIFKEKTVKKFLSRVIPYLKGEKKEIFILKSTYEILSKEIDIFEIINKYNGNEIKVIDGNKEDYSKLCNIFVGKKQVYFISSDEELNNKINHLNRELINFKNQIIIGKVNQNGYITTNYKYIINFTCDKNNNFSLIYKSFIKALSNSNVVIDHTIFLIDRKDFWDNFLLFLESYNYKIFIPIHCITIINNMLNTADNKTYNIVQHNYEMYENGKNKNLIIEINNLLSEIWHDDADIIFETVKDMTAYRDIVYITHNKKIAEYIYLINNESYNQNSVKIVSLINNQLEEKFKLRLDKDKDDIFYNNNISEKEKFKVINTLTDIKDDIIKIKRIPKMGSILTTNNGTTIKLTKLLGDGGEGYIYETDHDYLAKIYKKGKHTKQKIEKLKILISKEHTDNNICFPIETLIYNNNIVGFLMNKAKGTELNTMFINRSKFLNIFPKWSKKDSLQLSLTILNKIKYLHDKNIIIGDLNPSNILVVSPKQIYFVDTDSYQIEGFPCPVGQIPYTPPELQGLDFKNILRKKTSDYFAVSILLFMIVIEGKNPFSKLNGGSPIENIKEMDFSYPHKGFDNKLTPKGRWISLWESLPTELKDAFFESFRKKEKYSTEKQRITIAKWIKIYNKVLKKEMK